ncbi:hypothetical protein [Planococcus sp. CAU13]|uniref:hypothetical protein n=1 Tax=Planococcus sp. CAU13 TaxID=1541197 RepID=UPI00053005BC|nr:hypothetical protein [Planococcus sp. CAU13]
MDKNRETQNNAQEKGFNSTAAYGDPKDQMHPKPDSAELRDGKDSPFEMDADGNISTGDGGEPGTGIYTGNQADDLASPNDNLTDIAGTGRNRGNVPLMDRQIEDIPANDPNAADAGPVNTGRGTEDVRKTDSVINDLASIDVSREGLPANNQAKSDIPADAAINDVPDADRSVRDSPEHLSQNARDRTQRNDRE